MYGKWIYFAGAALLSVLTAFFNSPIIIVVLILYIIFLYRLKHFSHKQLATTFLIILIYYTHSDVVKNNRESQLSEKQTDFVVSFIDGIKYDGDVLQATAKEIRTNEKLVVRYRFRSHDEKEYYKKNLIIGDACKVKGSLLIPDEARNANSFNYKKYLNDHNIFWTMQMSQLDIHSCRPYDRSVIMKLGKLRQQGIAYIEEHYPPETASLSAALIFGDRQLFDPDLLNSYQKLGIIHLLAISGLHVGMLSSMVYFLGIRLGVTRERMIDFLFVFLPIYALLTGAAPSVLRAVTMLLLGLLTIRKKGIRKISPIDAISVTLLLFLFINPFSLFDVGFQLSFAVSFALVMSAPVILSSYKNYLVQLFVTSIIAQLAALPIMLYHFYEFSLLSFIVNLVYIPLFSFIFLPGTLLVFFIHFFFSLPGNVLLRLLTKFIQYMNTFTEELSQFPYATLVVGRPHWVLLIVYVLAVIVVFLFWEKQQTVKGVVKLFFIPTFIIFVQLQIPNISPIGEVTFIDVGQGDSIFIQLPFGKGNYLIDSGGNLFFDKEQWQQRKKQFEVGRDIVVPFLKGKGITTIDKLILTHGDADHIGGSLNILDQITVKEIILPKSKQLSSLELKILQIAKQKSIQVSFAHEGVNWQEGESNFHFVSPRETGEDERNDGSLVLAAEIGGLTWLFTGDLEVNGEERFVKNYGNLSIDVLKAGHHGSKSSSSEQFLKATSPKMAIISVGRNNRYNHPHREVIERYEGKHIHLLRTDQLGAITYTFFGKRGTFTTMLP